MARQGKAMHPERAARAARSGLRSGLEWLGEARHGVAGSGAEWWVGARLGLLWRGELRRGKARRAPRPRGESRGAGLRRRAL